MYPAKTGDDIGTINLASRPFDAPFSHGFWVSAPAADSVAVMTKTYTAFSLTASVSPKTAGKGWSLRWNYRGEVR